MEETSTGRKVYRAHDLLPKLVQYGLAGHKKESNEVLTGLLTVLLDQIEELGKGDALTLDGFGTFEITLEPARWIYFPRSKKFRRKHRKHWSLTFKPSAELRKWLAENIPDEVIEPTAQKDENSDAKNAE